MHRHSTALVAETGGPRARLTDPDTSHLAAEGSDLAGSQDVVYQILDLAGADGATDEEILEQARMNAILRNGRVYTGSRLRTARAELVARGIVVDAGRTRPTRSRYQSRIWMLERFEEDEAA